MKTTASNLHPAVVHGAGLWRKAECPPKVSGEYLCAMKNGHCAVLPYSAKHGAFNAHDDYKPEHALTHRVIAWAELWHPDRVAKEGQA